MAEHTLADWLSLSRPHLSRELVDDESYDWLLMVARHLPGDAMAAIEVRLGPGKAPVDLSVRLTEPRQGLQIAPHLPASCTFLEQLFRDWADGAPSTRGIHSLWLEFDADRDTGDDLPDPVVCARLQAGLEVGTLVRHLLPRLQASPLTAAQERLLKLAWGERPASVTPLYAFSLRARQRGVVRLEVYAEDLEKLLAWLRRIEHPATQHLDRQVRALQNVDRFHVSCDVGSDGWLSRVGFEGSFRRWPHQEPGWQDLVDHLVEERSCASGKARVLWNWPGHDSSVEGFRVRALSHVKLGFAEQATVDAKAYLLLHYLLPS